VKKAEFYSNGYYAGLAPESRFREVMTMLGKLKGERLLDIGCGDGSFTVLLKEALGAKEAAGIEIASEAITAVEEKGIRACQLDIDTEPYPFDDDYFDVIYCGEIIEHLFNPDHLLEEVYRTLKPEGICLISTPNLAGWPNRFALLLGFQPYPTAVSPSHEGMGKLIVKDSEGQWGHIRVFTLRALKELLEFYNFRIIKVKGSTSTITSGKLPAVSLVDKLFSHIPSLATRVIVMVGKK